MFNCLYAQHLVCMTVIPNSQIHVGISHFIWYLCFSCCLKVPFTHPQTLSTKPLPTVGREIYVDMKFSLYLDLYMLLYAQCLHLKSPKKDACANIIRQHILFFMSLSVSTLQGKWYQALPIYDFAVRWKQKQVWKLVYQNMLVTHRYCSIYIVHSHNIRLCWLDYFPEFTSIHIFAFLSIERETGAQNYVCMLVCR